MHDPYGYWPKPTADSWRRGVTAAFAAWLVGGLVLLGVALGRELDDTPPSPYVGPGTTSLRKLCGDPACSSASRSQAHTRAREQDHDRQARDEAIMAQIRSGEQYGRIARQFGLSEPRIARMTRAAGIRRYRQRTH